MNLTQAIVHEVVKESGQSTAEAHYAEALLPIDDALVALVQKLDRSFAGTRLVNARFDESPGKLFPQQFGDYANGSPSDAGFLDYSREVVGHLETVIQGKSGAKGGYLLLCAYDDAEGHRHAIFLLRNTVGRIFRREGGRFSIEPVVHLDTDQLAMACRIDVGRFRKNASSYLELTHRTESEVSAYFRDWIAAEETQSARALTAGLHDVLATIELPVDAETGEQASRAATFERAYEHVRANPSKVVDVHELSAELYGSPARLQEHARDQGIELDDEFRAAPASLREFVTMRAAAEGLDLRFPRAALEDGVMYIEGEGERMRVVIESPELAAAILGQG